MMESMESRSEESGRLEEEEEEREGEGEDSSSYSSAKKGGKVALTHRRMLMKLKHLRCVWRRLSC